MLILDSGGVSLLAERTPRAAALIIALRSQGAWPPTVPSMVLVECLTGSAGRDAPTNRFLTLCDIAERVPVPLARRAASLRSAAGQGSAIDALVAVTAEPDGVILTSDPRDLGALAALATRVRVERA